MIHKSKAESVRVLLRVEFVLSAKHSIPEGRMQEYRQSLDSAGSPRPKREYVLALLQPLHGEAVVETFTREVLIQGFSS